MTIGFKIKRAAKVFNSGVWVAAISPIIITAVFFFARYHLATKSLTIIYTNDLHGNIMPKNNRGGAAAISQLVNNLRKKDPELLLLDAGDFFQGTPESDLTFGENTVLVMNRLKYDAAAAGNHEFDFGVKNLRRLSNVAKFPLLAANIFSNDKKKSAASFIRPYIIKEIKGVRIAIIGLTSSKTPLMSVPKNVKDIYFADPVQTAIPLVKKLRQEADVIIALSHLGLEKDGKYDETKEGDVRLATLTSGEIDIIIGGHTHTEEKGLKVGRTLIVQTSGLGRTAGKLTVRVDRKSGRPVLITNSIIKISPQKTGEDIEMKKFVEKISSDISRKLSEIIGEATEDIIRAREGGVSPLGFFISEIMKQKTSSEIAFQNRGGVRADIKKGPVTLGDIYLVSPFDNTIVTMKLSGEAIRSIVLKSISNRSKNGAAVLDAAGLIITESPYSRDVKIELRGRKDGKKTETTRPLDDKIFYTVATNSFLAEGGDGFEEFKKDGINRRDTGIKLRDAIVDYISKDGKIKPPSQKSHTTETAEKF